MLDPVNPELERSTDKTKQSTPPASLPDATISATSNNESYLAPAAETHLSTADIGPSIAPRTKNASSMHTSSPIDSIYNPDLEQVDIRKDPKAAWAKASKADQDAWLMKTFGTTSPYAYEDNISSTDGEPDLDYELGADDYQEPPWSLEEEERWN